MLEHGGQLEAASRRYGIPRECWLDLSTGINPLGWPVPTPPPAVWRRLPEEKDGLAEAARVYYGAEALLPTAGSQAAIQLLPQMRSPCRVALLAPAYGEHERAWREAGHGVTAFADEEVEPVLDRLDVVVVVNPNNPTGRRVPREVLLRWHRRLAVRGGWLVVDEAFMDADPLESLVAGPPRAGLIVLRSLGKFFGLAGLRVGFVIGEWPLLASLGERLGPWAVSHPARWVATRALGDRAWQARERPRLVGASRRLQRLLGASGLAPAGGCELFQYVATRDEEGIAERLARCGILVRRFERPRALRFGLPGEEEQWSRLARALSEETRQAG
ncbi:threonine-phosphate decarboxylase CobD [Endothiovibrio diazotrophicus]